MIASIIELLQKNEFYGAGKYTEIAKGKNEIGNYSNKIKRKWLSKKK